MLQFTSPVPTQSVVWAVKKWIKKFPPEWLFLKWTHLYLCVLFHKKRKVNLTLFGCGVCPVASKSTVYLLCVALLLLHAHVCLGFLDGSPGPTDHTCGERELSARTSSSMTQKKKKRGKTRNQQLQLKLMFLTHKMCMRSTHSSPAIKVMCGCTKLLE